MLDMKLEQISDAIEQVQARGFSKGVTKHEEHGALADTRARSIQAPNAA